MSEDGGSSSQQQPPAPTNKKPAPATYSSFINKNAGSKKFVPKAGRRRPGAGAAAAPAKAPAPEATSTPTPTPASKPAEPDSTPAPEATSTSAPAPESSEPGSTLAPAATSTTPAPTPNPTEPDSTPAPSDPKTQREPSTTTTGTEPVINPRLPTPAPTQESVTQNAPVPTTTEASTTPAPPALVTAEPTPAPPTTTDNEPREEEDLVSRRTRPAEEELVSDRAPKRPRVEPSTVEEELPSPGPASHTTRPAEEELVSDRVPKRQRVAASTDEGALPSPRPTPGTQDDTTPTQSAPDEVQPATTSQSEVREVVPQPPETSTQEREGAEAQTANTQLPTQPRRRRKLPWVAVNQTQDGDGGSPAAARKTRQPAKTRGKRKTAASVADVATGDQEGGNEGGEEVREEDGEEGGEEGASQSARTRPSAKARGKRRVDNSITSEQNGNAEANTAAPVKKTRKTRKDKGKKRTRPTTEGGEEAAQEGEEPRRRKRRKNNRNAAEGGAEGGAEGDAEGEGEGEAAPKRKGRPPREPTPSDAEDEVIDTGTTFMDTLASQNIRVGKLSAREKRMRTIDWAEVRQRQRDEDARVINTREREDAVNRALEAAEAARDEATQTSSAPRYELIDGQIRVVTGNGAIDRQGDADREVEEMEVVDEDDLTTRITSRSFMKNNKRFPNDFILPGQGKRWTQDDTDLFYEGLRMFGSDFAMIATLFPGVTRRSIKLKYNREEKENMERILEAKRNPIEMDWDEYLKVSHREEEEFADADMIMQQLEAARLEMEEKIEEARAEAAERKRQEELAGNMGDGNANGKGRKQKAKQVTFQDEGVEVLGDIDDDETWGQQ